MTMQTSATFDYTLVPAEERLREAVPPQGVAAEERLCEAVPPQGVLVVRHRHRLAPPS